MKGQLTDEQFKSEYPHANISYSEGTAITKYGRNTINYWRQHSDGSWINCDCKTKY